MNAPPLSLEDDAVLDIAVVRDAAGRNRLVRRRVCYPWSLGRGYRPGRGCGPLTVIPQSAGAGLLAGDRFLQKITVESGASLKVVPAGASLVYGAPERCPSVSRWSLSLEGAAKASMVPEPHVLMPGADLVLSQDIVADADAVLICCDIVVIAPGTSDASFRVETRLRRPDGTAVFSDIQTASVRALRRTVKMPGAFQAFATVFVISRSEILETLFSDIERYVHGAGSSIWGSCAELRAGSGIGIRLTSPDAGRVRSVARDLNDLAANALGL